MTDEWQLVKDCKGLAMNSGRYNSCRCNASARLLMDTRCMHMQTLSFGGADVHKMKFQQHRTSTSDERVVHRDLWDGWLGGYVGVRLA